MTFKPFPKRALIFLMVGLRGRCSTASVYPLADGWTQGAGRGSRVEDFHQPEKCLGSKTTSDSNPLGDSAVQHKERGSFSAAELRCHQVQDWACWHVHSADLNRIAL